MTTQMMAPFGGLEEELSGSEIPQPFTDKPTFYLHRFITMPMTQWELQTGLRRATSTPEQMAETYKKVVKKRAVRPGLERESFGSWQAANTTSPDQDEEVASENSLIAGNYRVDFGLITEGTPTEERPEAEMGIDYFIMVDPAMVRGEGLVPKKGSPPLSAEVKGAAVLGLVVGGIATASLVKKGVGLRLLAGLAGGVIGAGIFAQGARAMQDLGAEA